MKKKVPYRVENIVRNGGLNYLLQASFRFLSVFYSYISLVRQNAALCGNGLTLNNTFKYR